MAKHATREERPVGYFNIPLGQPYVVICDRAIQYRPSQTMLPGKHKPGVYVDLDDVEHPIRYMSLSSQEKYMLSRGATNADLEAMYRGFDEDGAEAGERDARLPLRPIEERVQRVRETYSYRLIESHEIWRTYIAIEDGVDKHEITAILTERGWSAVGCSCEAFDNFDEMCVHCVYFGEWTEDTKMPNDLARNGNGNHLVKSEPAALMQRRERQAEFYAVVNDIYFQGKGTPALLDFVAVYCERNELDVFAGHIHVIERRSKVTNGDQDEWKSTWSVMTGIHGYLAQADRTGEFEGITKKQWCNAKGEWFDIWLQEGNPAGARVTVHRKGRLPIEGVVTWAVKAQYVDEYEGYGRQRHKTGNKVLSGLWATDGPGQLMKCALSQALRQAFPNSARFRSDGLSSLTVDTDDGGEQDLERVVVDDGQELSPEQHQRVDQYRQAEHAETIHDAEYRDDAGETELAPPVDFAAAQRKRMRESLIGIIRTHTNRNEWIAEIDRRHGDHNLSLDYATLCDLKAEIDRGDTPWLPKQPEPSTPRPASAPVTSSNSAQDGQPGPEVARPTADADAGSSASAPAAVHSTDQVVTERKIAATKKDDAFIAKLQARIEKGGARQIIKAMVAKVYGDDEYAFFAMLFREFQVKDLGKFDIVGLRTVGDSLVDIARKDEFLDKADVDMVAVWNRELQGAEDEGEPVEETPPVGGRRYRRSPGRAGPR